jgi:uncharacterized protein YciI
VYVVVVRRGGTGWRSGVPLVEQPLWHEHALYMDGLATAALVRVGGPLGPGPAALLVCDAASEEAVLERLADDPWTQADILPPRAAYRWEIVLGEAVPGRIRRRHSHYVAVQSEQGPSWRGGTAMREQRLWSEHAAFMNALDAEGFVLTGGPLEGHDGVHRALLVVDADSLKDVYARLAPDPWLEHGMLRLLGVDVWNVRIGEPANP